MSDLLRKIEYMVGKMRASRKVTNKDIYKQKTILIRLFLLALADSKQVSINPGMRKGLATKRAQVWL